MARKSRKNLNNAPAHQITQPEYVVGGYIRISVENDTSIDNQEAVIHEYLNRHPEMQLHKIYVDAGISSFAEKRPQFEAMIKDAEIKRINCVIIKDLSRFGRNYIETCDYLEQILPAWGIRVISILDDYDSKGIYGSTDFRAALKSIINYTYSRDISIKVKSVVKMKQQKGTYIPARLPFGYRKGKTDGRTCFEIDPDAAHIVRYIFQLAADGASAFEIAGVLNQDKVTPPGMSISKAENTLSALWTRSTVSRILRNETYAGCFLTGNPARHNFTFAHELGHYFLSHQPNYKQDGQLSIRCTISETDTEQKGREREANRFAVELLMPQDRFGLLMAGAEIDFALISGLAIEFMVSKQACSYRIAELTNKPCVIIFSQNRFITSSTSSRAAKGFFGGHEILPNETRASECVEYKRQQNNFSECDSNMWLNRAVPNQTIYECTRGSYNDGVAMTILKW